MEQEILEVLKQYEEDDFITAGELTRIITLAEKKKNEKAIKAHMKTQQQLP